MAVRIVDVCEVTKPIASPIRNAYIDFSKMTTSLVAVVTDVVRDGRRVVGYGFNSNGRYGQGGLIRERFAPRLREADPSTLLDATGDNLDPDRVWSAMIANEKPGGHGERSVAVGTLDMAVWDAAAKIAGKPLFRLLAKRHGVEANPRVFVYAAGGYYYPGKDLSALRAEMRGYLDRGYSVVRDEDRWRFARGRSPADRGGPGGNRQCRQAGCRRQRSLRSGDRHRLRQRCFAITRCSGTRSR
jgi:L-alanine-DL-glutamate epimerase-like enolase superfamily enzyme